MPNWITEQVAVSGAAISAERWPEFVEKMGISAVVNLRQEYQDVFAQPFPVAYLWLSVKDHTAPTLEQMVLGAQFIDTAVQAGRRVLVHCKMGIGRSPTMVAAYLVWKGQAVDDAIRQVEGTRWTYYNGFFRPVPTRGIHLNWVPQVWRVSSPRIEDHGGFLIVLLSLGVIVLINCAPGFITRPKVAALACAAILALVSTYHLARCWLEELRTWDIRDGSVSVGPGVKMVLVGALVLLYVALVEWKKSSTHEPTSV